MTQAARRKLTFEEYASLDAEDWVQLGLPEGRVEFWDGEIIELPTESELNDWIAFVLRDILIRYVNPRLIRIGRCEVEVPGRPRTRYPDLVILREEHLAQTQRRLLITLKMAPPQLVAEVVSPGSQNQQRDYKAKRIQYQDRGIPEYWLIDPEQQSVTILTLESGTYKEFGRFQASELISSPQFGELPLSATQLFEESAQ